MKCTFSCCIRLLPHDSVDSALAPSRWWEWGVSRPYCVSLETTGAAGVESRWQWSAEDLFLNCEQLLLAGRAASELWHTRWALSCSWVPIQCMFLLYTSGHYHLWVASTAVLLTQQLHRNVTYSFDVLNIWQMSLTQHIYRNVRYSFFSTWEMLFVIAWMHSYLSVLLWNDMNSDFSPGKSYLNW